MSRLLVIKIAITLAGVALCGVAVSGAKLGYWRAEVASIIYMVAGFMFGFVAFFHSAGRG